MLLRLAVGGTFVPVEVIPKGDLPSTVTYEQTAESDVNAKYTYYTKVEEVYTAVDEPKKQDIANYYEASATKIPVIIGDLKEGIWYFDRA